jgi:hypothetical protein
MVKITIHSSGIRNSQVSNKGRALVNNSFIFQLTIVAQKSKPSGTLHARQATITLQAFQMDKYDFMVLDIVHTYKQEQQAHIRLAVLERNFWKRIEADTDLSVGQARIGERITNLYLDGMVQNKNGYALTKKGREQLAFAPWKKAEVA